MISRQRAQAASHPTPMTYLKVAAVLIALTAIEVVVFYIDPLKPAFVPIFLLLSLAKFTLVIMFYMHLKMDNRFFSGAFVGGLLLAVAVVVGLMSLFQVLSAKANPPEEQAVVDGGLPSETVTPGGTAAPPEPQTGQELFLSPPSNAGPQALWCSQCHVIEGISGGLTGPDLTHVGTDAATRKPGFSAEEYIRESIKLPEEHIAEGVERATPGLMTSSITEGLTVAQVDALVEFLLAQN